MSAHQPPKDVAETAQRAVAWIEEDKAGKGFPDTGRHRAHQLADRHDVSDEQIGKMKRYFSRHQHDSEAEGFHRGEDGYPSPGRVAWDAWGGDAGRDWEQQKKFEDL